MAKKNRPMTVRQYEKKNGNYTTVSEYERRNGIGKMTVSEYESYQNARGQTPREKLIQQIKDQNWQKEAKQRRKQEAERQRNAEALHEQQREQGSRNTDAWKALSMQEQRRTGAYGQGTNEQAYRDKQYIDSHGGVSGGGLEALARYKQEPEAQKRTAAWKQAAQEDAQAAYIAKTAYDSAGKDRKPMTAEEQQRARDLMYRDYSQRYSDMQKDAVAAGTRQAAGRQRTLNAKYGNDPDKLRGLYSFINRARQAKNPGQLTGGATHEGYEAAKEQAAKTGQSLREMRNEQYAYRESGANDYGNDPYVMSMKGLQGSAEELRKRQGATGRQAEETFLDFENKMRAPGEKWGGVFDLLESMDERGLMNAGMRSGANESESRGAADRLDEMRGSKEDRRALTISRAEEYLNGEYDPEIWGRDWQDESMREGMRAAMYDAIMPESYAERTRNMSQAQKDALDRKIDEAIEAANSAELMDRAERDTQADKLAGLSNYYKEKAEDQEDVIKERERMEQMASFVGDVVPTSEYRPEYVTVQERTETAEDEDGIRRNMVTRIPQGSREDKAVFYMNEGGDGLAGNDARLAAKVALATPEMKEQFTSFYNYDKENGTNLAGQYLDAIDGYLTSRFTEQEDYSLRAISETPMMGEMMHIATFPMNAIGGMIGTAGAIGEKLGIGSAKDKNSGWYAITKMVKTLREEDNNDAAEDIAKFVSTGEDGQINEETYQKAKNVGVFLLNTFDSVGDNILAMYTAKGITGDLASDASMRIIQMIMSGEATSNTMLEKLEAGVDPSEAAWFAIGDGIIEWVTERISLEAILRPDRNRVLKSLIRGITAEGSEEIHADLLNLGLDYVLSELNNHQSEIVQKVYALIDQGMDEKEALRQVWSEKLTQIGLSGLAGAISGGLLTSGNMMLNTVNQTREGGAIRESNRTGDLISAAREANLSPESVEQAEQLQKRMDEGKKLSRRQIGKLAQTVEADAAETIQKRGATEDEIGRSMRALDTLNDVRGLKEETGDAEKTGRIWARQNDIDSAEGERITDGNEVISNNRFTRLLGVEKDGNTFRFRVETESGEQTVDTVQATGYGTAAILREVTTNPGLYSEEFANKMLEARESNQVRNAGTLAMDAMRLRLSAYTGQAMPERVNIPRALAIELYNMSLEEHAANRKAQVGSRSLKQGRITINGAEYGSKAWNQQMKSLDRTAREQVESIAGIAQRAGIEVTFMDLNATEQALREQGEESPAAEIYGWQRKNTIAVNIEGEDVLTIDGEETRNRHNMVVTFGHEMTHWLQDHSLRGYNALEKYVMDRHIRNQGMSWLANRIEAYTNQGMDLEGALSEIVANTCDQVLTDRSVAEHIQQTDTTLYGEIKGFVKDLVSRIKAAVKNLDASASYESRAMMRTANELNKLWLGAFDDALTQKITAAEESETPVTRKSKAQLDSDYMAAEEAHDKGAMRTILDELARRAGFSTEIAYHGTTAFGFTVFDLGRGRNAIFVAYGEEAAKHYNYRGNVRNISDRALGDIENMTDGQLLTEARQRITERRGDPVDSIELLDNGKYRISWYESDEGRNRTLDWSRREVEQEIRSTARRSGELNGSYQLYTRPGRQLVLDAHENKSVEIHIDGELAERMGTDVVNSRMIAKFAMDNGYDSVRIRNVRDAGGVVTDYGIFFKEADVKSADLVTYDDRGNIIKPSERFNENNKDIRFSRAQNAVNAEETRYSRMAQENMEVNSWMMSATASTVQTEDERELLQAYRDLRIRMSLSMKRQMDYRTKIRSLEARTDLTNAEKDDLRGLRNKLEIQQKKMADMEDELFQITSSEGYAGIMYRNNMVLNDFIMGRSQEQVRQSVEDMLKQVTAAQEQIRKDTEELKALAETQAVKAMRSFLGKSSLDEMAGMLRTAFNSVMSKSEIGDRLAEISLKMAAKQDVQADTEQLARDLMDKMRGIRTDNLAYVKGTTLVIGEHMRDELKAEHWTMQMLRDMLKGTGIDIRTDRNSRFIQTWNELRENNQGLPDVNGMSESDALHTITEWAAREVEMSRGVNQTEVDFDEMALLVKSAATNVTTYLSGDQNARKQITQLMNQIKELSAKTEKTAADMEKLNGLMDDVVTAGQKATAKAASLSLDVNQAIDYYNRSARAAAETERTRVRKALIEQLRSEHTKELMKQQDAFKEQMKNDRNARELAQDNMILRSRINEVANRIGQRLFAETDEKNVQEEAKGLARFVMQMLVMHDDVFRKVTFMTKAQRLNALQRLTKMNAAYGEFDPETDLDWLIIRQGETVDTEIRDKVQDLLTDIETGLLEYRNAEGQKNVSLMDRKAALEKVQEAVSQIWNVIQARGQAFIAGKKVQILDLAQTMEKEMANSRFKGERTGRGAQARESVTGFLNYGNLTPEYFFKNLKNKAIDLLKQGLNWAENKAGLEALKAKQRLEQIAEETGYATWDGQEKHAVMTMRGEIRMTTEQIMALYATWMRESSQLRPEDTAHLLNGGFVLAENRENKGMPRREKQSQQPIRMNKDMLNALGSYLTQEQLKYVRLIVEYMSGDLAELGNEASMQSYGIRKFTERYYFPIKSWSGVLNSRSDAGVKNSSDNRAMRQSFTRRVRGGASNAVEIADFTPTATKHIVGMITFNTVGPAVENINKVLNQQLEYGDVTYDEDGEVLEDDRYKRNMGAAFQEAYGKQALDYLKQFMQDINGGVGGRYGSTIWDRMLGVFKKGAVGGSLSVAAQQPLSYIRAATMVNPKYLAKALMTELWSGAYEELLQYSGVAVIKEMGKFDMSVGRSMQDYIAPEEKTGKAKAAWNWLEDKSTALPGKMDALTWTRMWVAVKAEQADLNPGMDVKSEAFLAKAAERFNDLMRQTQVYDSIMVKSPNMRNTHPFMKTVTSFMAEPTLSLNVLADAWQNIGTAGGKRRAVKALVTFMMSAAAQAAVKAFFSTGRTPDKKKTQEENYLYRLGVNLINEANPFGLIPGYNQMIDLIKEGELTDNSMSVIGKAKDVVTNLLALVKGGEEINWYRKVEDSFGQFLQLATNVPLKNAMRDFRAMVNFFSGGQAEALTGGTYAKRATSGAVLKFQLKDSFMSEDMVGLVNTLLQEAGYGYGTKKKDYTGRIYEAEKAGNTKAAEELKEYVTAGMGAKEENVQSDLRSLTKSDEGLSYERRIEDLRKRGMKDSDIASWVGSLYKDGKITKDEAEKLYLKANPKKTKDDAYFYFEQAEYEQKNNVDLSSSDYFRLYEALRKNDRTAWDKAARELTEHGHKEEDVTAQTKSFITKEYKEGRLSRTKAVEYFSRYAKEMTQDDIWWTLDRIDYASQTGNDGVSGQYYRLKDAIANGRQEDMTRAVTTMTAHGMKQKDIKSWIGSKSTGYKTEYLAATGKAKEALRLKLIKAYKAVGVSESEAIKIINGWKSETK